MKSAAPYEQKRWSRGIRRNTISEKRDLWVDAPHPEGSMDEKSISIPYHILSTEPAQTPGQPGTSGASETPD